MVERSDEWLSQSENDYETAKFMFKGKRYLYAMLMCHLSVERALKGLFVALKNRKAPEENDLVVLYNALGIKSEGAEKLLHQLNEVSVITSSSEDMEVVSSTYSKELTEETISKVARFLTWIKEQIK